MIRDLNISPKGSFRRPQFILHYRLKFGLRSRAIYKNQRWGAVDNLLSRGWEVE